MSTATRVPRLRRAAGAPAVPGAQRTRPSSTASGWMPETQRLQLGGNRGTLAWTSYGPATGFPVLYLHGYPSSRLEPVLMAEMAARHRLRLIAPDRPGFGLSSPQPRRAIADYPADLRELALHLGLRRYAVLGGSGGGPYAVACAHPTLGLPRANLAAVGVLAGAPPWDAGVHHVDWGRRTLGALSRAAPTLLRLTADVLVWITRRLLDTAYVKTRIEKMLTDLGEKERQKKAAKRAERIAAGESVEEDPQPSHLTPAERREMVVHPLLEGFAQGAGAAVQEARILTEPWGFKFEDVDYDKLFIWHGAKDTNAPIEMVRWMAKRMPNCRLIEFPDDSHYTIGGKLDQILDELVTEDIRTGA